MKACRLKIIIEVALLISATFLLNKSTVGGPTSWIEENKGQHPSTALFIGKAEGFNMYFFRDSIVYQRYREINNLKADTSAALLPYSNLKDTRKLVVINQETKLLQNTSQVIALVPNQPTGAYINYFLGNDPSKWIKKLPGYSSLCYKTPGGIWDINVFCQGDTIVIFDGNTLLQFSASGNISTDAAVSPLLYSGFIAKKSNVNSICLDKAGNIYMTGRTSNSSFPLIHHPVDTVFKVIEAFISKLDPAGSTLLYSTYFGGGDTDYGTCIKINKAGTKVYFSGFTKSGDLPVTSGVIQATSGGMGDGFLACMSADFDSLLFSTYLGVGENDGIGDFVLDSLQNIILTGFSTYGFPTTPPVYQFKNGGFADIIVCKLTPDASAFIFSTFIGGGKSELGNKIAIGKDGHYYIYANSMGGSPMTPYSYNPTYGGGGYDVYLCKLSSDGAKLIGSTYLGGYNNETSGGLCVTSDAMYVGGTTWSNDFQVTPGSYDVTLNGAYDAFICRLSLDIDSLYFSTFIGGNESDRINDIGIWQNHICFAGYAAAGFPVSECAYDPTNNANSRDIIFGVLNTSGNDLEYSTYFGGMNSDEVNSIFIKGDSVAFCGNTTSQDFPVTPGCYNPFYVPSDPNGFFSIMAIRFVPLAGFSIPDTVCSNTTVNYNNTSLCADTVRWNFGDGSTSAVYSPVYSYSTPGNYQINLIVYNPFGSDTISKWITVEDNNLIDRQESICSGDSAFLAGAWQHSAGLFIDTIPSATSCDTIIKTTLTIFPKYFSNFQDSICEGDSVWLAGNWQHLPGLYTDSLITSAGCDSIINVQLDVFPIPSGITLLSDTAVCENVELFLDAGVPGLHYLWNTGDTTEAVVVDPESMIYSVTVTNDFNCSAIAGINVKAVAVPYSDLTDTISLCQGDEVILDAGSCSNCNYLWSNGSNTNIITISETGIYSLVIKNELCELADSVLITPCAVIEMPNVFTPNDDDVNDIFKPKTYESIEQYELHVYSRWGNLIFSTNDIKEGWDGKTKGQECSSGTYYYYITYSGPGTGNSVRKEELQGIVTLVR